MKHHLISSLFAGLLCLPATFSLTRAGSIPMALGILVAISAFGGLLSARLPLNVGVVRIRGILTAFAIGAVVSEAVAFFIYFFSDGLNDPKLGVGISVSFLELGVILAIGMLMVTIAAKVVCHITS